MEKVINIKLFYNNKDITRYINIIKPIINDYAGGNADSIKITLSDIDKEWRRYTPVKGDVINLIYDDFKTGDMYIDEFYISRGIIVLKALSTNLIAKEIKSRSWEDIRFKKIATDLCNDIGLNVEFYNINDYFYKRLDQINLTNLSFLNQLCLLEGYRLKINNNRAIIYSEKDFEKMDPVDCYGESDFLGGYYFKNTNKDIFSSCNIVTPDLQYTFNPSVVLTAPKLNIGNIDIRNYGEAERFSRNILRSRNKREIQGKFNIRLEPLGAGSCINIKLNGFSGKYFIEKITHDLSKTISTLEVRKVLEGY